MKGMVVAAQPEAAEAGARILQRGGNAIDAAVATAFAQGVVDPQMTSIAGYGTMHIYLPASGRHCCLEFYSRAPAGVRPDVWADKITGESRDGFTFMVEGSANELGHQSVGTLGNLAGYAHALSSFGTLALADAMAPAIAIAREGFVVRPHVYQYWALDKRAGNVDTIDKLRYSRTGRAVYFEPDGQLKRLGSRITNPDLARSLERIAAVGPELFYQGEMAQQIAADMAANDGFLSLDDLRHYQVHETEPVWGSYRGIRIAALPPPGGGVSLIQVLQVMEHFDVKALGHNTAAYIAVLAEAMKWITIDKDTHLGDPMFVDVPVDRLLSPEHAASIAQRIRHGERASVDRYQAPIAPPEPRDTTQNCVIDAQGNTVSLTHTLGMPSGVITDGLGFMYNGLLSGFDPRPGRPASLGPGKSRISSQCPAILFKDGNPFMVLGAPGGTAIIPALAQSIMNVVDFGMSMLEAVAAPRVSVTSNTIDVSNRIPRYVTDELEQQGYPVARSYQSYAFAAPHAILVDGNGHLSGAADPQRDGVALAVS